MMKNEHKKLEKRVLSAAAAAAIAGSQVLTAIPFSATAAYASQQISSSQDNINVMESEPAEIDYGDVDHNGKLT